ncbi:MAG: hypothetical protein KDI83_01515 [Gammaproteobacteria bacterium]|nr:hypothetical protein [Gammaproteobacteria bacterium]
MEIVLAVLLLFGGFALGSIDSENGGGGSQPSIALPDSEDATGSHPVRQIHGQNDLTQCLPNGSVIYLDLTLPYPGRTGECEAGCPDE